MAVRGKTYPWAVSLDDKHVVTEFLKLQRVYVSTEYREQLEDAVANQKRLYGILAITVQTNTVLTYYCPFLCANYPAGEAELMAYECQDKSFLWCDWYMFRKRFVSPLYGPTFWCIVLPIGFATVIIGVLLFAFFLSLGLRLASYVLGMTLRPTIRFFMCVADTNCNPFF
jgi:hypothetical protein